MKDPHKKSMAFLKTERRSSPLEWTLNYIPRKDAFVEAKKDIFAPPGVCVVACCVLWCVVAHGVCVCVVSWFVVHCVTELYLSLCVSRVSRTGSLNPDFKDDDYVPDALFFDKPNSADVRSSMWCCTHL